MSSFGYDTSRLLRFLQFVTRTFALGRFFAVHVRMYWAALLLPLLFLGWVPANSALDTIVLVAIVFLGLFAIIWTHEMGHILAGRRYHIRTDLITLGPLGGVAHLNAPASNPRQELWISLAGPAVHLVWLAVLWPLYWLLPYRVLDLDGWQVCPIEYAVWYLMRTNEGLLLFNLLPIFPLDGGRVLRALLSLRVHPNRATLWATTCGMIGGGLLIVLSMMWPRLESTIGLLIGISCVLESLQERRLARHVLVYQTPARRPWENDGESWRHGRHGDGQGRSVGPGWFARLRARRAERIQAQKRQTAAELEREVDAILERLHSVGLRGLSPADRKTLKRASQRRRGAG